MAVGELHTQSQLPTTLYGLRRAKRIQTTREEFSMKLSGKTALVTGGGSGIGAGIALALAGEGCRVAIAGRQVEKLREVAVQFKGKPPIEVFPCDVASRENVNQMFSRIAETLGPVHILVNGAGVNIKTRSMAEMKPEQWDQVMAINATGAYNCMHAVLPQLASAAMG